MDTHADRRVPFDQAESEARQENGVLGTVVLVQTALLFAEDDIQEPVEGVFHTPIGTKVCWRL